MDKQKLIDMANDRRASLAVDIGYATLMYEKASYTERKYWRAEIESLNRQLANILTADEIRKL